MNAVDVANMDANGIKFQVKHYWKKPKMAKDRF